MNNKKTLIFIGAYFYGNVGDDLYPLIIKKYLRKDYDLHFFNSDINDFDDYLKTSGVNKIDGIIFGGGGLLFDDGTAHLEYMKYYADFANKNNIPYGFISIGVQLVNSENTDYFATELLKWKPILEGAKFIYCRHDEDKKYFIKHLPQRIEIRHIRDLGYLIRKFVEDTDIFSLEEKYNVLVYSNCLNKKSFARKMKSEGVDKIPLQILLFSPENSLKDKNMLSFINLFKSPSKIIIQVENPLLAATIISSANKVFTGRYHGLVMSRVYRKCCYFPDTDMPVKFYKESSGKPEPSENNFTFVKHL